jgi:transketolase
VAIIATGPLVYEALQAAQQLSQEGIGSIVANVHTIKPLDEEKIIALAQECRAVVTVEEHQVTGGLGGAVAECLSKHAPTKMAFVGVQDQFGQTGTPAELIAYYALDSHSISEVVRDMLR